MDPHRIVLGGWATLKASARLVREEVFIQEQQIPVEEEWDDTDDVCLHAVACDAKGDVVGTARLLPDGHIGRMAVRVPGRGSGVGGAILLKLMHEARARGHRDVVPSAQIRAEKFYSCHGFVHEGEEYLSRMFRCGTSFLKRIPSSIVEPRASLPWAIDSTSGFHIAH